MVSFWTDRTLNALYMHAIVQSALPFFLSYIYFKLFLFFLFSQNDNESKMRFYLAFRPNFVFVWLLVHTFICSFVHPPIHPSIHLFILLLFFIVSCMNPCLLYIDFILLNCLTQPFSYILENIDSLITMATH